MVHTKGSNECCEDTYGPLHGTPVKQAKRWDDGKSDYVPHLPKKSHVGSLIFPSSLGWKGVRAIDDQNFNVTAQLRAHRGQFTVVFWRESSDALIY